MEDFPDEIEQKRNMYLQLFVVPKEEKFEYNQFDEDEKEINEVETSSPLNKSSNSHIMKKIDKESKMQIKQTKKAKNIRKFDSHKIQKKQIINVNSKNTNEIIKETLNTIENKLVNIQEKAIEDSEKVEAELSVKNMELLEGIFPMFVEQLIADWDNIFSILIDDLLCHTINEINLTEDLKKKHNKKIEKIILDEKSKPQIEANNPFKDLLSELDDYLEIENEISRKIRVENLSKK